MSLLKLDSVPGLIRLERDRLAEISSPREALDAEKRAAAIAELTKRAGLAVPIQNEATFLRAEALERLSVLVDEEEKPKGGRGKTRPNSGPVLPKQRIAEGRALAQTGAIEEARQEAEKHPDVPVSMDSILKRAKRRQREQELGGRREKKEALARAEIESSDHPVYHLTVSDIRHWAPGHVDAIITDPPYVGDSIPLYEALRDFAVEVLEAGSPLVVMTWQGILPEVIDALRHPELVYRWTICWRYANTENTVDYSRRVFDCWKPILVYHKDFIPEDVRMFRDEIANQNPDKSFHEWGQSVDGFERLVTSFSEPGEIICDPFLGGGTTAISALACARRFAGCDIDVKAVATTKARLT